MASKNNCNGLVRDWAAILSDYIKKNNVQYRLLHKRKRPSNLYLRVICVVCCTHAEVSIGRTGSPKEKHFTLIIAKEANFILLLYKYDAVALHKNSHFHKPLIDTINFTHIDYDHQYNGKLVET